MANRMAGWPSCVVDRRQRVSLRCCVVALQAYVGVACRPEPDSCCPSFASVQQVACGIALACHCGGDIMDMHEFVDAVGRPKSPGSIHDQPSTVDFWARRLKDTFRSQCVLTEK